MKADVSRAAREAAAFVYPERFACVSCGREIFDGSDFCPDCRGKLSRNEGRFCEKCGMPVEGEERFCLRCEEISCAFERAYAVYRYDEATKPLLRRFKEQGERWLGRAFAREMWAYMREFSIEADLVTFVPSGAKKCGKRGYNPAEALARELSEISGIPCEATLEKVRESDPQKELGFRARQENLRGCFRLLSARRTETRRVLLVDDVATTLATANECCGILSKVCENGVKVLTFCTTVRKIRTE